ncbi:MAG: DUF4232 domain-containing protein [Acidimicrobiales bacterium]
MRVHHAKAASQWPHGRSKASTSSSVPFCTASQLETTFPGATPGSPIFVQLPPWSPADGAAIYSIGLMNISTTACALQGASDLRTLVNGQDTTSPSTVVNWHPDSTGVNPYTPLSVVLQPGDTAIQKVLSLPNPMASQPGRQAWTMVLNLPNGGGPLQLGLSPASASNGAASPFIPLPVSSDGELLAYPIVPVSDLAAPPPGS